jgi:hypothetical protein
MVVSGAAFAGVGTGTLQWNPPPGTRGTFYFTCTVANAVGSATSLPFTVTVT